MIHRTGATVQTQSPSHMLFSDKNWQQLLAESITEPAQLIERLKLPVELLEPMQQACQQFSLRVSEPYLRLIEAGNPQDPLLLQVLPQRQEMDTTPGYITDPLAEADSTPDSGVVHKYRGRLLLIISGGCAINCRYCFRRHFPYQDNQLGPQQWQAALDYLQAHPEVDEVIFSGGDPLATPDNRLIQLIDALEALPQLKRLRIHTRLPIAIPQRLTDPLRQRLSDSRLQVVMVLHSNHANELGAEFSHWLAPWRNSGITLLNQAVLLRGINDNAETLINLSHALFNNGILPYYLHLLDPVAGAAHFDLGDAAPKRERSARQLVGQIAAQLPGYLVPKLTRELPGAAAKVQLSPILPE